MKSAERCSRARHPRAAVPTRVCGGQRTTALPVLAMLFTLSIAPPLPLPPSPKTSQPTRHHRLAVFWRYELVRLGQHESKPRVTGFLKDEQLFPSPTGTILNSEDDFSLSFDVMLEDYAIGTRPGGSAPSRSPSASLNLDQATKTNFFRARHQRHLRPEESRRVQFLPRVRLFLPTLDRSSFHQQRVALQRQQSARPDAGRNFA